MRREPGRGRRQDTDHELQRCEEGVEVREVGAWQRAIEDVERSKGSGKCGFGELASTKRVFGPKATRLTGARGEPAIARNPPWSLTR